MRFYPKLGIYRNSTKNNSFDGREARSYGWYVYAVVLSDGTLIECENNYSPTTAKHMRAFNRCIGRYDGKCILAPRGLGNLDVARNAVMGEIAKLEAELLNKRNRDIAGRKARIAKLVAMLPMIAAIEADRAKVAA